MFRIAFLVFFLTAGMANADTFWGFVLDVQDGDTFRMRTSEAEVVTIRLCGIDAPEAGEAGYEESKAALSEHLLPRVGGGVVYCTPVGSRSICDGRSDKLSHGRIVAQCFDRLIRDGGPNAQFRFDIGLYMVRKGMACDWPKFSGGAYRDAVPEACIRPD